MDWMAVSRGSPCRQQNSSGSVTFSPLWVVIWGNSGRNTQSEGSCTSMRKQPGPMAWGMAGGTWKRCPGSHLEPMQPRLHETDVLGTNRLGQLRRVYALLPAEEDVGPLTGDLPRAEDKPRLGLAELATQVVPHELRAGMGLDLEPFGGVQQLDQQGGPAAETSDMLGAEDGRRHMPEADR